MMNRLCPSEKALSEYLSGAASAAESAAVERHLAVCGKCRQLLSEAYAVVSRRDMPEILEDISSGMGRNRWALIALLSLVCSFFLGRYFLQFLAVFMISGARWISETKDRKILIMINEAWKRGDAGHLEEILSKKGKT
jgi:predicted anti-sigma-YlaC factor YlaD